MKTIKTTAGLLATGALLLAGAPGADARPACSDGPNPDDCPTQLTQMPIKVYGTFNSGGRSRIPVYSAPVKNASVVRYVYHDTPALIVCQTKGRPLFGPFGRSTIWNGLKKGGYVNDAYVYTGSDGFATRTRC